jgi:hypothetical protein
MSWRALLIAVAAIFPASMAFAQSFPGHDDICVAPISNGKPDAKAAKIVSKQDLATAILTSNGDWMKFYVRASVHANSSSYTPAWRAIFLDAPGFCKNNPACLGPPLPKKGLPADPNAKPDATAALDMIGQLQDAMFTALNADRSGTFYRFPHEKMTLDYLVGKNEQDAIICTKTDLPPAPKAVVLKMPENLRLRANSDDLNIGSKEDAFKTVKPATINYTRDDVQKSNTAKLQAALGYAFVRDFDLPPGFSFLHGELVPYISAVQSITKTPGKVPTFADSNNVATGALFNARIGLDAVAGWNNYITAKPQYLWNTKDKSEIASMRFIYQPWTQNLVSSALNLKLNTPIPISSFVGGDPTWLQLLFDLRDDVGGYNKKSTDPTVAITQTSYHRAGSKFGIGISTNDKTAHVVLTVTETLLYGFTGSVKHLDLFESTLSFYFDSTSNYAFTLSYSKGNNEDTAERAQTYMAGLSVKF